MTFLGVRQSLELLSLAAVPPGVASVQQVEVTAIDSLPGPVKAVSSFLLVLLIGWVILHRSETRVHRSLDAIIDSPYSAVPYGLLAYILALAVGLYGFSQLGRVGMADTVLGRLVTLLLLGVIISLTAYGFLVVGMLVTEVQGQRRPSYGLLVGAVLSAVGWLVLPTVGGVAVWVLVAAFGLGGAVRRWFHDERSIETSRSG